MNDSNKLYLSRDKGDGRWALSREIEGHSIALIEDTKLFHQNDALTVLAALQIPPTDENLDFYFPIRRKKGRCPTIELLDLFAQLGGKGKSDGRSSV